MSVLILIVRVPRGVVVLVSVGKNAFSLLLGQWFWSLHLQHMTAVMPPVRVCMTLCVRGVFLCLGLHLLGLCVCVCLCLHLCCVLLLVER